MASSPSGVSRQLLASSQGDGRVTAWARQVENLDIKEAELQASQTKVLRDQVTALVQELTAVRQEVSLLKAKQVDFDSAVGLSANLPGSMMSRLVDLEDTANALPQIHDSMNKESEALRQQLEKTNKAIEEAKVFTTDKIAPVMKRVEELEHNTTSGFDKDWREIQDLKTSVGEHSASLSQNGKDFAQYRISMDERLKSLEKHASETFEKHGADLIVLKQADEKKYRDIADVKSQITPIEVKLESVSVEFTETYEKHFKEINANKDSIAKASLAQAKADKEIEGVKASLGRFSTVNEQITALQDELMETSTTHVKDLREVQGSLDKHIDRVAKDLLWVKSHGATLDSRFDSLDRHIESTLDSHSEEFKALKEIKERLTSDLASLSLDQKRNAGQLERLMLFEKKSEELFNKQAFDLNGLQEVQENHANDVDRKLQACGQELKSVEKSVGDLSYKTAKDTQAVKTALDKHVQDFLRAMEDIEIKRNELVQQNNHLDARSTGAAEKMSADIVILKDQQRKMENSIHLLQGTDDGLEKKVAAVEELVQGEEQKRVMDVSSLKASLHKQTDVQGKTQQDVKVLDDLHKSLNEHLTGLETCMKDTHEVQAQEVADLKTVQSVVARDISTMKNSAVKLGAETAANAQDQASIKDRLSALENRLRQCFNVP